MRLGSCQRRRCHGDEETDRSGELTHGLNGSGSYPRSKMRNGYAVQSRRKDDNDTASRMSGDGESMQRSGSEVADEDTDYEKARRDCSNTEM